jgi:hypothetical protein
MTGAGLSPVDRDHPLPDRARRTGTALSRTVRELFSTAERHLPRHSPETVELLRSEGLVYTIPKRGTYLAENKPWPLGPSLPHILSR